MNERVKAFYKVIAHSDPGTKFKAVYAFSGSTVYTVSTRGNRKILVTENNRRGRVITSPCTVENVIGRPIRVELLEKTA